MKIKYESKPRVYKDLKYWKVGDKVVTTTAHPDDENIYSRFDIEIGNIYTISHIRDGHGKWEGEVVINLVEFEKNILPPGFISTSFLNISNE